MIIISKTKLFILPHSGYTLSSIANHNDSSTNVLSKRHFIPINLDV